MALVASDALRGALRVECITTLRVCHLGRSILATRFRRTHWTVSCRSQIMVTSR